MKQPHIAAPSAAPVAKRWLRRLLVIACVPVLGHVAWTLFWRVPGRLDFLLLRPWYEDVVDVMRSRPPTHDRRPEAFLSDTVRAYAERDAEGHLSITLSTADWGHYGKAGYLFSDEPPKRIEGDPYCDVDAPGDLWILGEQVAPHWWVVSNDLQ